MQAAAGGDCGCRVAGLLRSAVLRLEQIDVAGAGDVEGMGIGAVQPARFAGQRKVAIADWAKQH